MLVLPIPDRAWADGIPLSAGHTSTLYFRNTPSLLNASRTEFLDWDGRFAGDDMTTAVRDHLAEAHFMAIDGRLLVERLRQVPEYERSFEELFGSEASYGKVLAALAEFVATLQSSENPYLQFRAGDTNALSREARAGLDLFEGKAGCSTCHSGELLADGEFHATGVPENPAIFREPDRHITFRRFFKQFGIGDYVTLRADPGLFALTHDEADRGKFRTPSLLEAARTAPYMHNGMLESLEDVVRFYDAGGRTGADADSVLRPLDLSDAEIAALIAFLGSLSGAETPFEEPEVPPYALRELGAN